MLIPLIFNRHFFWPQLAEVPEPGIEPESGINQSQGSTLTIAAT